MNPRKLCLTFGLTLLLLAGINGLIQRLSANTVPRQVLRTLTLTNPAPKVVAVGNSVVQSGFDAAAFAAGWTQFGQATLAVNGGLGATGPAQHLLLARAALRTQPRLHTLIYGCFDYMLTEPTQGPWWRLFGNNAMVFYTEPEVAARHLAGSALGRWVFRILGSIPIFVERGALWAKVERLRRRCGGLGLPAVAVNQFGRVEDFQQLVPEGDSAFRTKAVALVRQSQPLSPAVTELLEAARTSGVKVRVVLMPMPSIHRTRHYLAPEWQAYVAHLRGLLEAWGATLTEASDWVTDDALFMDALHLGPEGAARFSRQLGQVLAETP